MPSFRFQAKKAFLTYSQCPLETQHLYDELNARYPIKYYSIGREQHDDNNFHLHGLFEFHQKLRSSDPRLFDVGIYHPNIGALRHSSADLARVLHYTQKDGNYISNWPSDTKLSYGDILSTSTTADDFLSLIEKNYPRDAILFSERIANFAEKRWPTTRPTYVHDSSVQFNLPQLIQEWLLHEFTKVS